MSLKWPPKDKDETLDYSLDWSRALEGGETIQSVAWYIVDSTDTKVAFASGQTVEGLRHVSQSNTTTVATIYLDLGNENQEYKIFCAVTTTSSRVKERSVKIRIREFN
jgi:hypothetical protein